MPENTFIQDETGSGKSPKKVNTKAVPNDKNELTLRNPYQERVGALVQEYFPKILKNCSIKEIHLLCTAEYSRQIFGLNIPVLSTQMQIVNGRQLYYDTSYPLHTNEYYICRQWNERHRTKIINWLEQKINVKTSDEDDSELEDIPVQEGIDRFYLETKFKNWLRKIKIDEERIKTHLNQVVEAIESEHKSAYEIRYLTKKEIKGYLPYTEGPEDGWMYYLLFRLKNKAYN